MISYKGVYLSKWSFPNKRVNLVAVEPLLAWLHYVVVILIIISVIVYAYSPHVF